MKALILTSFGAISLLGSAAAGIPRDAFTGNQYAEAEAEARESGKPLAIVLTDTASSCPKCQAGNAEVFKRMRSSKYVMVVQDQANKGDALPGDVRGKVGEVQRTIGNFIPIVAVISPGEKRLLGGLSYNQIASDGRSAFRTLEDEAERKMAEAPAPAPAETPAKTEPSSDDPQGDVACETGVREFTNSLGHTITAEVVRVSSTHVTFRLENGSSVDYPLVKLSEESRETVKECAP